MCNAKPINAFEKFYAMSPQSIGAVDVLIIGAGIGLAAAGYLLRQARHLGIELTVAVADAGPLDLLTHMAHTRFPRHPVIHQSMERVGGKLSIWGVSAPRPPASHLVKNWPYETADLIRRFKANEDEMGVSCRTPMSGLGLESRLLGLYRSTFPNDQFRVAPLAINRDQRRWCPLDYLPNAVRGGLRILPNFRCKRLRCKNGRITSVRGASGNGKKYKLRAKFVALGVGVESSLPLVTQVARGKLDLEPADHIRIDLHGMLPECHFGDLSVNEQGIAVLLMEYASREHGIPAHFEIKVAPKAMWARGYMQSSDNLRGSDSDETIYAQIQCVSAMHDRIPVRDLLNVDCAIPPVMSGRDASLHGELITMMRRLSDAIGLSAPTFCLRPLLTNHHCYGAYRVGKHVSQQFQFAGIDNFFILPPSAYVDSDDDANPTLKSLVLAEYAMDEILLRLRSDS